MTSQSNTVLIVEDIPSVASLYANWLEGEYEVKTAATASEAYEKLDSGIDLALVDRQLPDATGDEVLDTIRARELDCRVAMVTAIEPDIDIIDMGFDDYVMKPVDRNELIRVVRTLQRRATFDAQSQEFFRLASKKAVLESSSTGREQNEEYRTLCERLEDLEGELGETLTDLSDVDFEAVIRTLPA